LAAVFAPLVHLKEDGATVFPDVALIVAAFPHRLFVFGWRDFEASLQLGENDIVVEAVCLGHVDLRIKNAAALCGAMVVAPGVSPEAAT
jgi:hypothetical protein